VKISYKEDSEKVQTKPQRPKLVSKNKKFKHPGRSYDPVRDKNLYNPDRDGNLRIQGISYQELSSILNVGICTEQFLVVIELMKGGHSRVEIAGRLKKLLPPTTRNGTPKPVAQLIVNAVSLLDKHGFVVNSGWQMVFPKK
jgi:hypothetical protein